MDIGDPGRKTDTDRLIEGRGQTMAVVTEELRGETEINGVVKHIWRGALKHLLVARAQDSYFDGHVASSRASRGIMNDALWISRREFLHSLHGSK
jgi:hypothetical protein